MTDVVLINPPLSKERYRHQPYIPIGLAYLAAVLETEGARAEVIDCPTLNIDHSKLKQRLTKVQPELVGITAMTPTIESALLCAKTAKETRPEALVVLGGPHATFMDREILAENPYVDIVARGEGEQTIKELACALTGKMKLRDVKGITFRRKKVENE